MAPACQLEAKCKLSAGQGLNDSLYLPLMMELLSSACQFQRLQSVQRDQLYSACKQGIRGE